ncbi:MAG: peptidyl-prolyl cis-trans isomerase [Saprospiraceae bacterium]|nr:MAG: peptidyl-prolyl cis-trans isomerase [Saprospiraceae bacterium]
MPELRARSWVLVFVAAAALLPLLRCSQSNSKDKGDDRTLARVYNKTLHLSDMEGMIPEGMTSEDSSVIIDAFVENWVREAAMLYEAEHNIPKGLDINKLVEDYRSSLIKHNYENVLVAEFLDSTITEKELQEFYEQNKEQYKLETPIIRCRFIKAARNAHQLKLAENWWNSSKAEDLVNLRNWCNATAVVHHLQDSSWYKVDDIAAYMPQGTLTVNNVKYRRDFVQRDDSFQYFFKVLELVSRPEIAPLSYIENQARKVILHKRKTLLLENMKEKFYEEALRKNDITIYK